MSTVPLPESGPSDESQTRTAKLPEGASIPVNRVGGAQFSHWIGRRIGPYRIQKLLGRGGMGAVFLADRDDQEFTKSVALKVLHFDTGDPATQGRFRNERQILAALDHPNIAGLLDGGTTEDGQPYIVMEYVIGEPLIAYRTSHSLTIPARLRLFRNICDAVQYAHQKLIVHRDLKPGNILVTAEGVPKLLDFGIAKLLLDPSLAGEGAQHTQTAAFMMTPDYASPEQINGEPVSTSTDIYSLGAVLYELLTGNKPHRLTKYDFAELRREICENDPKAPSTIGGAALKGDLDNIVLKAMHREPARRYRSVEQFSEDVLNHLERRPVLARPDTLGYRLSRFAARNRWGIAACFAVAASLTAGTLVSLSQARAAQQRFEQVRKLANRFIELHDDVAKLPGSTQVREKMVATALDYLDNLGRGAGDDAELLNEIGRAYDRIAKAQGAPGQPNLGKTDDALRSFRKSIEFESRAANLNPSYRVQLADEQSFFAYLAMLSGHLQEARAKLAAAAALLDRLRTEKPNDPTLLSLAASVALHRGDLTEYEGHAKDGLPFFQQAASLTAEYVRLNPTNVARARLNLAMGVYATSLLENRRYDEALQVLHEAAKISDALLAAEPDNPVYIRQKMSEANYEGSVYDSEGGVGLGKPIEAAAADRRYVALAQRLVNSDPNNFSARLSLAIAYYRLSYPLGKTDPPEALRAVQRSLEIFNEDLARRPNDHLLRSRRARALRYLAYALDRNRRHEDAVRALEQAVEIQKQLLAETPSDASEKEEIALSEKVLAAMRKE